MKKVKIIFFGTPKFAEIILRALIESKNLLVEAVVTQPDKVVGRKQILTPSPVKILAQKHDIPVFEYKSPTSIIRIIEVKKPDLIVVTAFGKILPSYILEIPRFGCLGVHPSLLPKYRGPTPIRAAILNGEKQTGVTIFLLDEKMDHGKIISNFQFPISNKKITYQDLSEKLAQLGADLLIKTIPKWIKGDLKPQSQDHKKATYTHLLTKKDGFVEWKKIVLATQRGGSTSQKIERMVRALNPWPGVWTKIGYKDMKILKILKAHLEEGKLVLDEVQLEGKNPVSWKDFLQGHRRLFT